MFRLALFVALLGVTPAIVTVRPGPRPTKNMLFVVDVSGSMGSTEFARALGAVAMIAGQPIDDGAFGVLAFADQPTRFKHNGRDWFELPSERSVKRATTWLAASGSSGNTLLAPALKAALRDKRRKLTIIVVSDGFLGGRSEELDCLKAIREGQALRVKAKLGKALVMCYGVGSYPAAVGTHSTLAKIAKAGGGGFYRSAR